MASQNLNWRQMEKWGPLGVYSKRPKLGPGGWSSHSYFMEEIRGPTKPVAWCKSTATGFDWVFDVLREKGVVLSRVNMWYARDRDENPTLHNNYYAFFETLHDALLFRTYLEDYPQDLADHRHHIFFSYLNGLFPNEKFERR